MSAFKRQLVLTGLLISLCATPFASVTAFASTSSTEAATTATETAQVFTIDKAIEYAKANSKTLASCKAAEQYQKYYMDEARLTFRNTKKAVNSVYSTGLSDINTSLVSNGFVYRSAKMQHRIAQRNTIQQEYALECNVSQVFYGYLSLISVEESALEALNMAKDNATYAKIRFNGGMISELDLSEFEYSLAEAQCDYDEAVRNREIGMLSLKSALNYPLDKELIVTGTFTRYPMSDVPLETALAQSKNSITHANIEEAYKLAQEKLNRYHSFYSSNQAAWHSASAEFTNAELTYNTSLEQEIIGIYNAYNDMVNGYNALDLCDMSLANAKKALDAIKLQYDMGTATANQYIATTEAYNLAKEAVTVAEVAAYAAVVNYEMTFDCVNTIFEEDDPLL